MRSLDVSDPLTITAAATVTGDSVRIPSNATSLTLYSNFDYGSGGTTVKVYLQTTFDGGDTWVDIAQHAFATADAKKISKVTRNVAAAAGSSAVDAALSDNTILEGIVGTHARIKVVSDGTYAGSTTLTLDVLAG